MFLLREIADIADTARIIAACLGQKQLTQDHRFNKFADCLGSLLPENMYTLSRNTIVPDASGVGTSRMLESPFHRAVLYSTINGLAGCPGLPAPHLLQIYSSISGYTRSYPSIAMRSLVDNIFRASVMSRSTQAVDALLKMTVGTPHAIDVNKVITAENRAPSMPIEVALDTVRPDLETAEVLLRAGADPTRALEIFMKHFVFMEHMVSPKPSSLKFIRQLLDKGAKPNAMSIQPSWQLAGGAVAELLLSGIPRTSYHMFFEDHGCPHINDVGILANTALYLRNSAATRVIKRVLCEWPREEIEKMFTRTFVHTMDYTLIHTCVKGNIELTKFLLPFVSRISATALAAAVRTRQQPLIEMLLESGANVSDLPEYEAHRSTTKCHCPYQNFQPNLLSPELSTPLAEAIRSGNRQLAQKLEYTLARADSTSLRQALEAAAEVGDLEYFQVILYRAPRTKGDHLRRALCLAIDQNRDDLAFMLLEAGAEVNGPQKFPPTYSKDFPLIVAMKARRKKLVEAMLQHDVRLHEDHYIRAAALWGDVDIVKKLLSSQALVSTRALKTALRAGDENILHMLLDHFWRYDGRYQRCNEGFRTEYDEYYGDDELLELVISAFCLKNDSLLTSFLEHGAKVGGQALRAAVRRKDTAILNRLLAYATRDGEVLEEVVKSSNQSILRQWLSEGANLVREGVFLHAMRFDKPSYCILMEAFKARYPQGLKRWGGVLLKNAIRKGDSSLLKELLAAKVDVNSFGHLHILGSKGSYDSTSYTPLGLAICRKKGKNFDDVQMLLDAGSNPNCMARRGWPDISGWQTPLLLAIETGNLELVELLLTRGADVNLAARYGRKRAPLQMACEIGSYPMVELLLSWQVNVNGEAADEAGATALQLAAIGGSIKIAKLLLQNGADIRARPAKVQGRTPFEGAAEHGRLDMLKVIWDATFPEGIGKEEVSNAINLSRMNGHKGCEQYIRYLVPAAEILELSDHTREQRRPPSPHFLFPSLIPEQRERLGYESDLESSSDSDIGSDIESDEDAGCNTHIERSSGEIMEDSDSDD
ncbi:Protein fem-1-like protein [Seiridium cupressi]